MPALIKRMTDGTGTEADSLGQLFTHWRSSVQPLASTSDTTNEEAHTATAHDGGWVSTQESGMGTLHRIRVSDGRTITAEESGPATGVPIFLLHGTPGSRSGPSPAAACCTSWGSA